jgi:predicted transcriptional regulator
MGPTPVTNIRLPEQLKARAQRAAAADQRTLSGLIVKLLTDHVAAFEAEHGPIEEPAEQGQP